MATWEMPRRDGPRPEYSPGMPSHLAILRRASRVPLYGALAWPTKEEESVSEYCTWSLVLATQSGLVARMVAAPAPPAETMCASVSLPWSSFVSLVLSPPFLLLLSLFLLLLLLLLPLAAKLLLSSFLRRCSRNTYFKYPYVVKYTPQFGNSAAIVGPRPLYNPLAPSFRAIFLKLSSVLIYVESLVSETCSLVFKTSSGQTTMAAIAPDVAPDTQLTTPASESGR